MFDKKKPVQTNRDIVVRIFEAHGDDLRYYLKPTVGRTDADDLVQATFLRLLERQTAVELNVPWAYIKTAGWRLAHELKVRRSKSPVIYSSAMVAAHGDRADPIERDPAETLLAIDELERVRSRLRPIYWTILSLHCQRLSTGEIAERVRLSVHTVKIYLVRAKRAARILKDDTVRQEFPLALRQCLTVNVLAERSIRNFLEGWAILSVGTMSHYWHRAGDGFASLCGRSAGPEEPFEPGDAGKCKTCNRIYNNSMRS